MLRRRRGAVDTRLSNHVLLRMPRRLAEWRPGNYLRNSGWLMVWLIVRAASQAAMVVLLARSLGAQVYGEFIAALAVASFFTPLAGMGLQALILRDGSADLDALPQIIARALTIWRIGWLGASLLSTLVAWVVLPHPVPFPILLLLCAGEVGAASVVEIIGRSEQARQHPQRFGQLLAGLALARLAGLGGLLALDLLSLRAWMIVYAASSAVYAAVAVVSVARFRGIAASAEVPYRKLLKQGLPFVGGAVAHRIQAELNKPILAHLGYSLAGNFNVAQRAVDIASLPLLALQEALWPRVFASTDPRRRLITSGVPIMATALLGGALLSWLSPLLPRLLGTGFGSTSSLLALLAWLPAVQVLRGLSSALLMADRRYDILLRVYILGAAVTIVLNLTLILAFSLRGAVVSVYVGELVIIGFQALLAWMPRIARHR